MINGVMFQAFHWYLPSDGNHWKWLTDHIEELSQKGITSVWLPPLSKSWGGIIPNGNQQTPGYDIYDLWDLGQYEAHSTVRRTKYGTFDELKALIEKCHLLANRLDVYADIVFNHKVGANQSKTIRVQEVENSDKNTIKGDWQDRLVFSEFNFESRINEQRADPNSASNNEFVWSSQHFDAVQSYGRYYRMKVKNFQAEPDIHFDHVPYLLGFDVDTSHPDVYEELCRYGEWLVNNIKIDGFRIDAIKHIRKSFFPSFLNRVRTSTNKELFSVGELWADNDLSRLTNFISETNNCLSLFDFRLRANFWQAANLGASYSLKHIFDNTLVSHDPIHAVTFVDNHDMQPNRGGKSFDLIKHEWFKPLAYALMLLRPNGYPCVFFGDYYPSELYKDGVVRPRHQFMIDTFLEARKTCVGGYVVDYFDHDNCIGWVSRGETLKTMAVVMSNGNNGYKWMNTSKPNTQYKDSTHHKSETITTDLNGFAQFTCLGGKVSVWIEA